MRVIALCFTAVALMFVLISQPLALFSFGSIDGLKYVSKPAGHKSHPIKCTKTNESFYKVRVKIVTRRTDRFGNNAKITVHTNTHQHHSNETSMHDKLKMHVIDDTDNFIVRTGMLSLL